MAHYAVHCLVVAWLTVALLVAASFCYAASKDFLYSCHAGGIMGEMQILFVSSEVFPFSKTGGLADVAGALPQALAALGHEVMVVSPWYQSLKQAAPLWIGDVAVPFDNGDASCGVGTLERDGVRYVFVGHELFNRDSLYGYPDDIYRFALFNRAVPVVVARNGFVPDVMHANDWHTGYLPMLVTHGWHMPEGFVGLPSVYTIHNAQYQGHSELATVLHWLRLPQGLQSSYLNYFGGASAMQAGVGFAHWVTTVSPSYAEEITLPEYGYGLDGTFASSRHKLSGILNGIDTDIWNPSQDPYLAQPYNAEDFRGKEIAKRELCERFGIADNRPLLGVVSRLADQKGIDIVVAALPQLLEQDWNIMVLGAGDSALEQAVRQATASNPGRVGSYIGYDEGFAHNIYAGADALMVPSRFEPCGLSQMIAMRYGTIPIARATGGLRDTIDHGVTGFLFEAAEPEGLLWATWGARNTYYTQDYWKLMMQRGMAKDFSWNSAAVAYEAIYKRIGRVNVD